MNSTVENKIPLVVVQSFKPKVRRYKGTITIGKDILELLTGAMYVEPLTLYREYIQNSTDAIDDAKAERLFSSQSPRIDISVDPISRSIKITDNGIGLTNREFIKVITAVGGSKKRGTSHRGFRGVGRLAGLGYCQELVFRSKTVSDNEVMEIRWDGRRLKEILNDPDWNGDLQELIKEVTRICSLEIGDFPDHFFEVEMHRVIRYRNDELLNEVEIAHYLSQVAPVPFSSTFRHATAIENWLSEYDINNHYAICINKDEQTLFRPYKNECEIREDVINDFHHIRFEIFRGLEGGIDAVGWFLDHDYIGAIPKKLGIHGIKLRSGNIQIGSADILAADIFPESRFNSWAVGEVHILSKKILPNGRRDNFIQNTHLLNLVGNLAPIGNGVAKISRNLSSERNRLKILDQLYSTSLGLFEIIEKGVLSKAEVKRVKGKLSSHIIKMKQLSGAQQNDRVGLIINELEARLPNVEIHEDAFEKLPKSKRAAYKEVIGILYDVMKNKKYAKFVIDEIVLRL